MSRERYINNYCTAFAMKKELGVVLHITECSFSFKRILLSRFGYFEPVNLQIYGLDIFLCQ